MNKPSMKPVYFIIFGVILGLGGFFLILANPFGWNSIRPILNTGSIQQPGQKSGKLVAAPAPILILPKGKQTYNVQGGETAISRVTSVTVDPLDALKDQTQSISVKVNSKEPISKFSIILNSDNGSHEYPLSLISGDESIGVWEGKYTLTDSTFKIYTFLFNIITNNGNKTVTPFPVR